MDLVAIVGAGPLGGDLAHVLARRDVARTVRLIDDDGHVAEGKALDIRQASAVEQFATDMQGSADLTSAAGAAVVVFADRAHGGEWTAEQALPLLQRIVRSTPSAFIVCADAGHRILMERGVRELKLARERLLGSAPEALASAIRALVALEANGSPRDVALSVLGVPPDHVVIPWDDATVGGIPLSRVLSEQARRRLSARVAPLWPPGPYALASAAALVTSVLLGRSRRRVSAFVAPDDSAGRRARTAALPLRRENNGSIVIEATELSVRDRVALDNAMLL